MTHERISPTAWLVAYQRSLTDIPLAPEMFHALEAILAQTHAAPEIDAVEALRYEQMGALWEARFKIVNHALRACNVDQVLEVAAGFSARGLALTQAGTRYVELDLPNVVQDKQRILQALVAQGKLSAPDRFYLVAGNALSRDDLRAAARPLAQRPIAIVNEGLLPYLDRTERTTFANHVRELLAQFGGVWITPDVDVALPRGEFGPATAVVRQRLDQVQGLTGVNVLRNRFESEAASREFFEALGFTVERHSFTEVSDQLVLPLTAPLVRALVEGGVLFVMRLKT